MLFYYEYFNHHVERLEKYICYYMRSIRSQAATRSRFSINLCHPDFRVYVNRAPTLKKHLSHFFQVYRNLTPIEQKTIYKAFLSTRSIKRLLSNQADCCKIETLPVAIQNPAKALFKYLYENTLDSVGNVKDHYEKFYNKLRLKVCPFCGIENLLHYYHYKQDYDHLLYKDAYPFAAVNMKNLVPMGRDCNTVYKKTKDILHDQHRNRRTAYYPFENHQEITVSLENSELPSPTNREGNWVIDISPNTDEVATWVDIYCIKSRYENDVLKAHYDTWLNMFINYAKANSEQYPMWNEENLKDALMKFVNMFSATNYDDQIFIKYAVVHVWINCAEESFYNALEAYLST